MNPQTKNRMSTSMMAQYDRVLGTQSFMAVKGEQLGAWAILALKERSVHESDHTESFDANSTPDFYKKPLNLNDFYDILEIEDGDGSSSVDVEAAPITAVFNRELSDNSTESVDENFSFTLYDKANNEHFNNFHNVLHRDVWEGFIPQYVKDSAVKKNIGDDAAIRRAKARSSRYAGTIGFRCCFCKNETANQRAKMSAVYPRSIKGIYRANIRFQRKHFRHCQFIPNDINQKYIALKSCGDISRGSKQYWVECALKKGLRDADNGDGIVFCPETQGFL